MIERILFWYGRAHGLRAILRYFNAAGADPDDELGEMHGPETHLIPRVIAAVFGWLDAVDVYGTNFDTSDGTAIRDYIYVTDLAEANVAAWQYLESGGASAAFNLGTGVGHSVREVVSAVDQTGGRKVPCQDFPRRAGDLPELVAEAHKPAAGLEGRPRYSDLQSIVETVWNRHCAVHELCQPIKTRHAHT
jgi:UDP-glucose 4-epimerase